MAKLPVGVMTLAGLLAFGGPLSNFVVGSPYPPPPCRSLQAKDALYMYKCVNLMCKSMYHFYYFVQGQTSSRSEFKDLGSLDLWGSTLKFCCWVPTRSVQAKDVLYSAVYSVSV